MWIDSHCHLATDSFRDDLDAVVERAKSAGVEGIIIIGAGHGLEGNGPAVELARTSPQFYAAVGIHPHDAAVVTGDGWLEALEAWEKDPKVCAIGEIGLDTHYDHAPLEIQEKRFREQLALARRLDLPVIIHSREAWEDTVAIVKEEKAQRGVFHCFTGSVQQAREAIALGFYISIPGVVTFKRPGDLPAVVREIPLERLLIETDAPYLAPVPHRGKRNEPAFVALVGRQIAAIRGIAPEEVGRITVNNTRELFGLR